MNILLTLLVLISAAQFALLFVVIAKFKQKIAKIESIFDDFISIFEPDGDKISKFAQTCQMVSDMAAKSIAMHLKAAVMGLESGASRGESAREKKQMGLSGLADVGSLMKNPLLQGLSSLLGSIPAGDNHKNGSNGDSTSPRFKM